MILPEGEWSTEGEADGAAGASSVAAPEKPRALALVPRSPDLGAVHVALGAAWEVAVARDREGLATIDARVRLVVLDDRLTKSLLADTKRVLECAPSAKVILAVGPESIGEILSAGLQGVRVGWLFRPLAAAAVAAEVRELGSLDERSPAVSERRAFPRARLEEPSVVTPPGVDLCDISPGGALLIAPPGWSVGDRHELALRLTRGAPVQRVVAQIIRAEPAPLGRQAVAARFAGPTARFQGLVRATILEHLTYRDLRKLLRRFREETSGCAPISSIARIGALLREILELQRPCIVRTTKRGRPWRSALVRVDDGSQRIELSRSAGAPWLHPGDAVDVFVHGSAESYLFEVRVIEADRDAISCTWPEVVHYSEKRFNKRRAVPAEAGAQVELEAPAPWGRRSWPLRDLSYGGLSFVTPASGAILLPGTPLPSLRVRIGDRTVAEHAGEIRYVAPLDEASVLVGIGLVEQPRAKRQEQRPRLPRPTSPASPQTARDLAHRPSSTPPSARRLRFFNSRNEVVSALLDTSVMGDAPFAAPVVVIAPAFGRSKECFSTLARWLCDRFGRLGQPVAVLRFDFTHSKGESHIAEPNRSPGRECLGFTLSSALDDLRAAVHFVHQTPLFEATSVVVVGYSMSAPLALRVAADEPSVSHVISVMGAPSIQDSVRSVMGGLDYVADHLRGKRHGIVNMLGYLVDMDELCRDAVASKLATSRDTERDVAALPASVQLSWLVGEHDGWVDRRVLDRILAVRRLGPQPDLVVLPTGHVPTISEEASAVADEATRLVWRTVHGDEIPPGPGPSPETLEHVAREEWARAPRAAIADRRACWADYLLGKGEGELGFDVLEWVGAYRDFMADQVRALDTRPGHVVLDAGGGTGNFLATLLDAAVPLPGRVEVTDLVPEALERARLKTRAAALRAGLAVDFRVMSVEVSRLRPVERFVRGDVHGPEWLRGRIEGLDDATLDRILELYGPSMHAALRGADLDDALADALSEHERRVIGELGRAARLVRGRLREDDLRSPGAGGLIPARTSHLRFEALAFGDVAVDEQLPLGSEAYDRILASLLLPYVANPDETVRELYRALKPGGRLVVSSNRPDTDMSEIFTRLVEDVERGRVPAPPGMDRDRFLDELRAYTSSAAFLLRLTEEQTFKFFPADQLRDMLGQAGFREIAIRPSFGHPPQAHVAVGLKA
jgi:ubiquinone/menaquinone biosynthesis C-methylase UbiE/dienelactone hydrolase